LSLNILLYYLEITNNHVWNDVCTVYLILFLNSICLGISLGGLIGGFFYEKIGGVLTFKLFSCSSFFMGILHVLYIVFSKTDVNGIATINWSDFCLTLSYLPNGMLLRNNYK